MLVAKSVGNIPIHLGQGCCQRVIAHHPEMTDQQAKIIETIAAPDRIQVGENGEMLGFYLTPHQPVPHGRQAPKPT